MKTQEILKHITELENHPSYDGRYKIKYALSSTLPDTAFMKFIEDEGFDMKIGDYVNKDEVRR